MSVSSHLGFVTHLLMRPHHDLKRWASVSALTHTGPWGVSKDPTYSKSLVPGDSPGPEKEGRVGRGRGEEGLSLGFPLTEPAVGTWV